MKLNILLLDDNADELSQLGLNIRELGVSRNNKSDQPWRVYLGNEELEVFCEFINDSDEAEKALKFGGHNEGLTDTDLILLDNDWEKQLRGKRFGLDTLKSIKWRRGVGPLLAIYTGAVTYNPNFVYEALSLGADALIDKREKTHLLNILLAAMERKRIRMELEKMRKLGGLLTEGDPGLISNSEAMKNVLQEAAYLAPWSKEPVLILGDIGTGKTRIARAIHNCSPRAKGPFVTLEPSQVSESLIHSELFGVERGAYTNALPRKGVLELADGGTLFIDELQNMHEDMQQALLNIIEGQPFRKVGDARERKADIRFIFASNVNPERLVNDKQLRGDFYSRIAMHILQLPTLGQRLEDIGRLGQEFISEFYADNLPGNATPTLTEQAVAKLQHAEWPYNVRSLRNLIRRTLVRVAGKPVLDADDLILEDKPATTPLEREDIRDILEIAPRAGSQRDVFKYLLERMPEAVAYEQLHSLIGEQIGLESSASNNLMTIISRLRSRLQVRGFDIIQDTSRKGYKLVKVA